MTKSRTRQSRKVYIVMAFKLSTKSTYVSEVCSSQKKAEEYCKYISDVMAKHDPDDHYSHWVYDARVM
jgi:hypothetical protein